MIGCGINGKPCAGLIIGERPGILIWMRELQKSRYMKSVKNAIVVGKPMAPLENKLSMAML
jgi:hypothetical protein